MDRLASILDDLRPLPRFAGLFCLWLTYHTHLWFTALEAPTVEQAGYASALALALVGIIRYWFEHERDK